MSAAKPEEVPESKSALEQASLPLPLFSRPWPGYWSTKTKLERIIYLKELIIHDQRWSIDMQTVRPLKEVIPGITDDGLQRARRIKQEITQLVLPVTWDLNAMGVGTHYHRKKDAGVEQKQLRIDYDMLMDYHRLPREGGGQQAYETVIHVLEQGIGIYQLRLEQAKRDLYNPLAWAAYAIRLPITVMERAGFGTHEKTQEMMLGAYGRFMKIMMSVILVLVALLLGFKVPWKEIVSGVLEWIFK
jgi:hypothetical protein